jgi:hypothetical protein
VNLETKKHINKWLAYLEVFIHAAKPFHHREPKACSSGRVEPELYGDGVPMEAVEVDTLQ